MRLRCRRTSRVIGKDFPSPLYSLSPREDSQGEGTPTFLSCFQNLPGRNPETCLPRRISKRQHSLTGTNPTVGIVGDKEITIEIEVIAEGGEMGTRGDEDARFDHATEHGFEPGFARGA